MNSDLKLHKDVQKRIEAIACERLSSFAICKVKHYFLILGWNLDK